MSSAQRQTMTDIPAPPYKTVSEEILKIAHQLKDGGHDQETIRMALNVFVEASKTSPTLAERNPF